MAGSWRAPTNKCDLEAVRGLEGASREDLTAHARELLTWLQDMNWPVARPMATLLARLGSALEEPVREVIASDDDIWTLSVISDLVAESDLDLARALEPELRRIAENPSAGERAEEVDAAARAVLERLDRV